MFITMLVVSFLISFLVVLLVTRMFKNSMLSILNRIVSPDLSQAWLRYLSFATIVVGVSGGVRIWELEKYITGKTVDDEPIILNLDRWVLEVYRTIIGTLQSAAWILFIFFIFSLIAYVIIRVFELRKNGRLAAK